MPQTVPRKERKEKPVIQTHDPLAPVSSQNSKPQAYKNTQVSQVTTKKPEVHQMSKDEDSSDEELSFQSIVQNKPSPTRVAMFLQECINEMNKDSDEESEEDMMSSEYDTDRSRTGRR